MKRVQNTHNFVSYEDFHDGLLAVVSAFNRPQRDALMIKKSCIQLERALFPLLVQISRFGPIGVVELANRVGRDYSTVSRQVAKLEEAGLAKRQKNSQDKRVNEADITAEGKAMTDRIDAVRAQIYDTVFMHWPCEEQAEFSRLLKRFVADFTAVEVSQRTG
ncbi:MarR family winged helix-turn-helix transcriptional regulator [Candidatus Pantoea bituminis]|uniref:MarR family winged helix-turn-helix transcriptional regulator n=1 Tax=Candidatus Pantoea bituminis TaxID=2831036 RepID=UPI001C05F1A1|nr:MarR family winged helix-turn-helix transcriptional regulator [Pantoea bituminis]